VVLGEFIGVFRMLPELGGVAGPVVLGVLLHTASLLAGTLVCGGMGGFAACFMVCGVKETLVRAGAGAYEKVAAADADAAAVAGAEQEGLLGPGAGRAVASSSSPARSAPPPSPTPDRR
jgi:hypothetical protein